MHSKKNKWLDKSSRIRQFLMTDTLDRPYYFGYTSVSAGEKTEKVKRHFTAVAARYDLMNTVLSFGIHYWWKRQAVRMMNLKKGDQVLDVCGGTGDLSVLSANKVGASGQVVLFDINREMITTGRPNVIRRTIHPNVSFIQGNAEHISFPDHTFDAVMVGFGIRNVTRMEKGLSEMYRVLKPGGQMMCLEFSKPTSPIFRWLYDVYSFHVMPQVGKLLVGLGQAYHHLSESIRMFAMPEEMSALLMSLGFKNVQFNRLTNGMVTIHLADKTG